MKKIYLSGALIFTAISAFSQLKTADFNGAYQPDPRVTHDVEPRGGNTLWSEDFANGIPTDWMVSTATGPVMWKYTLVGHTGAYPTAPLASTTSGNGWVIADSDADNTSGGANEDTRLISHKIDLTGFPNVKLQFQQMFRRWQSDITTVQISTDSVTWTNYVINGSITQSGTPNPDYVNIDISSIAGNQATVWVSFWWQGAWDYGWQIDDIAIKEISNNDIAMKNEMFGQNVEYYMIPTAQSQPMIFSSDVENIGMLTQTNIALDVVVNDGATNVYTGNSSTLASLAPWTTDSLGFSSGFTPTALGNYTITFNMNQTETDDVPANNTRMKTITVTDTVYALDNNNYQGQWYNQESGPGSSNPFVIGGVYDFYTNDVASSISVYIGNNTDIGVLFAVKIYEWDGAAWSFVNESDLYTVTANDLDNWVTVQLFAGVPVLAGGSYLAAVEHYGGADYLWIGYSSNSNRGYTVSSDDGAAFNNQPRVPMIRLNLGSAVGIEENEMLASAIYPNPANETINLTLNNVNENVLVEMIDVAGKIVLTKNCIGNSVLNVADFARGIYTIRLTANNAVQTTQVVLTK